MADQLPDGVYLRLPEEVYFAQDRLGSTDLCRLYLRGEGWWWASSLNPDYVPEKEDNAAKIFGKGLHASVLEGEKAYKARFGVIPTKDEMAAQYGDRFCVTVKDLMEALEKRGFNPPGNKPRAWYVEYCKTRASDLIIWEAFLEDWQEKNKKLLPLSSAEDRQIGIMREALHAHPQMGPLFQKGPDNLPLIEVSVLFTDEHGIRRRLRYDDLLPQVIIDLKAISNVGQRPLSFSVGEHVDTYAYPCQLADHQIGRKWLMRMVAAGNVQGGDKEERAWLARFPTEAPETSEYAWIFYQRPDAKNGRAPVVFPWVEDHGSEVHLDGIRMRRKAIQTYLRCMAEFGPDKPWTRVEPVHTTAEGAANRVYRPHWGAQEYTPGEEDDL